ncbi:uncharacterized protein NPIL_102631 [Nephila pilipes]|uniref:Uncharacterized protein n=1 Tax=Nephila pilipes TaxID=299642 RepID=A0A8X6NPG7_NEPPI|nr:uncharacterized protein NPIL_79471 [Nephila pilipes]GFT26552.1 uncharacterized protein NPIL_347771 [Nephila pilipes]GFT48736.1 uncharacterized protein NPIL_669771 [Nephila pilipes]GFT62897.1 uncharacterized protein NPIL_102631 [Nephila pilipes]
MLGLRPSSIRNLLNGVLNQYPYKLQSCHELLPSDIAEREAFARWALSKIEQDSSWVFNILWTDKANFSIHVCSKWVEKVTVNAQRYLTLLRETVVPCLRGKDALSTVPLMQDGASHTANPVKEFLIQTFEEERNIRKRCKSP